MADPKPLSRAAEIGAQVRPGRGCRPLPPGTRRLTASWGGHACAQGAPARLRLRAAVIFTARRPFGVIAGSGRGATRARLRTTAAQADALSFISRGFVCPRAPPAAAASAASAAAAAAARPRRRRTLHPSQGPARRGAGPGAGPARAGALPACPSHPGAAGWAARGAEAALTGRPGPTAQAQPPPLADAGRPRRRRHRPRASVGGLHRRCLRAQVLPPGLRPEAAAGFGVAGERVPACSRRLSGRRWRGCRHAGAAGTAARRGLGSGSRCAQMLAGSPAGRGAAGPARRGAHQPGSPEAGLPRIGT